MAMMIASDSGSLASASATLICSLGANRGEDAGAVAIAFFKNEKLAMLFDDEKRTLADLDSKECAREKVMAAELAEPTRHDETAGRAARQRRERVGF
jgi:hypothetical protein